MSDEEKLLRKILDIIIKVNNARGYNETIQAQQALLNIQAELQEYINEKDNIKISSYGMDSYI